MFIPGPVQRLIDAFSRLPGIGPKTASRLTFYLLRGGESLGIELEEALSNLQENTGFCSLCFNITLAENDKCEICASSDRDEELLFFSGMPFL